MWVSQRGLLYSRGFRSSEDIKRKPIRGGRWYVRKSRAKGRSWVAWTNSQVWDPGPRRKTFSTYEEAINYAQVRVRQRLEYLTRK